MTSTPVARSSRIESADSNYPTWWIVFSKELHDLWIGGKAFTLVLIYTILLGVISFVFASNNEVDLMPPKEIVFELLRISMAFGGLIGLIIGADSISGERERATLEWLLVAPGSRRQMVIGKFLAAISPWPAALAVSIPYWYWLAQGDDSFRLALIWGTVFGTMMIPGLTGLGMLVSFWSNTNRSSMFVSLTLYLLIMVPTQLPGTAQTGDMGRLFKKLSPMESTYHFLEKILVNNRTLDEMQSFLIAPAVFFAVVVALLWYFSAGLRLEAGKPDRLVSSLSRLLGVFILAIAVVVPVGLSSVAAQGGSPPVSGANLQITIDKEYADIKAGDPVLYGTVVTNNGTEESPPLILAMNIINLDSEGDVVDPEDWSPQRTQYSEPLAPGKSIEHSWRVNAILQGDYMLYMVLIPEPDGPTGTSHPVASSGIHISVAANQSLNPGGVVPLTVVIPAVIAGVMLVLFWRRRRAIDRGGES